MKKVYIKFGGSAPIQLQPVNYNVYKTGATVGIDGTDNMGYGDDILTLDYPNNPNNPVPQYDRFINRGNDGMGGIVYMDFSTSRRKTPTTGECLAYCSTPIGGGDLNFVNNTIQALSIDVGDVILNNWKMANIKHLQNILDYGRDAYVEGMFIGSVFNAFNSIRISSSTYMADGTEHFGYIDGIQGTVDNDDIGLHAVAVCWIEFPMP